MNHEFQESLDWNLDWPTEVSKDARVITVSDGKVQMVADSNSPDFKSTEVCSTDLFVAQTNETSWYCRQVNAEHVDVQARLVGLRELASVNQKLFSLASRSVQLLRWSHSHQYCGTCGRATESGKGEHVLKCISCQAMFYPKISPCVIVLIHKQDNILLARNIVHKDSAMFSLIAGFVEVGETIEQAVHREVKEEVGIDVDTITYQGSQTWPFPSQLMLGFYASYASGEINIQEDELLEADWYSIERLPEIPPELSIAGWMIRSFIQARD